MRVDESLVTVTNTCGVNLASGGGYTTSSGTFRDNFYICGPVPACDTGGSCTVVRNQSLRIDGSPVSPSYTIIYTCSGVTVQ